MDNSGTAAHDRLTPYQVEASESSRCPSDTIPPLPEDKRSVWGMGRNDSGILGDGTSIDRNLSIQIIPSGVIDLSTGNTGQAHALFVKSDGSLWGIGNGANGRLGNGETVARYAPIRIHSAGVEKIATGNAHSLFIDVNGSLWAFGKNDNGQLGDGSTTDRSNPIQVVSQGGSVVRPNLSSTLRYEWKPWALEEMTMGNWGMEVPPTARVRAGGSLGARADF